MLYEPLEIDLETYSNNFSRYNECCYDYIYPTQKTISKSKCDYVTFVSDGKRINGYNNCLYIGDDDSDNLVAIIHAGEIWNKREHGLVFRSGIRQMFYNRNKTYDWEKNYHLNDQGALRDSEELEDFWKTEIFSLLSQGNYLIGLGYLVTHCEVEHLNDNKGIKIKYFLNHVSNWEEKVGNDNRFSHSLIRHPLISCFKYLFQKHKMYGTEFLDDHCTEDLNSFKFLTSYNHPDRYRDKLYNAMTNVERKTTEAFRNIGVDVEVKYSGDKVSGSNNLYLFDITFDTNKVIQIFKKKLSIEEF